MNHEQTDRRLSAILNADVVSYSRLMEEDELWTVKTLETSKKLISEYVEEYKGRVVDAIGDNILAEFSSAVNAVDCAVNLQRELKIKNDKLTENRRMVFRIGINLGDVITKENYIFGDGVNIADRIQNLADPGGICISRSVYDQVKKKIDDIQYDYLGEHYVKNIDEPIRIYKVVIEKLPYKEGEIKPLINSYFDKTTQSITDRPSIVVIPFKNINGHPDQDYFCDNMTEVIITGLSKNSELFVVDRNISFFYKNNPVNTKHISEDIGVHYVVDGSITKQGSKVMITIRLIDAVKEYQLWSENFDCEMKDILTIQSEIIMQIYVILMELNLKKGDGKFSRN